MQLTCPQCGHTSVVTCGCHSHPLTHMSPGALLCTKCSAVNRLECDAAGNWGVRVPDIAELDRMLARPDVMVGVERLRREREASA